MKLAGSVSASERVATHYLSAMDPMKVPKTIDDEKPAMKRMAMS